MMVAETFEKDVVFPTIGNWDTMVPNQVDKRDYQGTNNTDDLRTL